MTEQNFSFAEKLSEVKANVKTVIDKNSFVKEYLNLASEKTQVEVEYIFLGCVILLSLIVILVLGLNFVIDLVGFVFPVIFSIKAIESKSLDDDKQWLTYWIVFIFFKLLEGVADLFVSSIPFYFFLKFAFLFWCWHPQLLGAQLIYNSFLKIYLIPLVGINVSSKVPTQQQQKVSQLELCIERVDIFDTNEKEIFVEVCAKPPPTRKATGIEETIFKTESCLGSNKDLRRTVLLSPLPDLDGSITLRIMEKMTFGDDKVIDFYDLDVKSVSQNSDSMKLTMESGEIELYGRYTPA